MTAHAMKGGSGAVPARRAWTTTSRKPINALEMLILVERLADVADR